MKKDNIKIFVSKKSDGSMKVLDDLDNEEILKNRKSFFEKNEVDFNNVVSAGLIHGSNVKIVKKGTRGIFFKETDGLITKEKNVFLTVTVADCLPIFLYDLNGKGVGILHGGWKGIINGIVENGIGKLIELLKCLPREVFLRIGPSIGPCCFEVEGKVVQYFEKYSNAIEIRNNKKYVNLRLIVKQIALQEGLLQSRIDIECDCTACISESFFSFRRDSPERVQAMIAGIGIRER